MTLFESITPNLNLDKYQYQIDAINDMANLNLGKIVLPTGSGKTSIQSAAIFNDTETK
jgi:superfamily II DNA or RNA helicase